jgi:hypothetical protein
MLIEFGLVWDVRIHGGFDVRGRQKCEAVAKVIGCLTVYGAGTDSRCIGCCV